MPDQSEPDQALCRFIKRNDSGYLPTNADIAMSSSWMSSMT
jgi:hypothetical protein